MSDDALSLYIRDIDEYIARLSPAGLRRLKSDIGKVVLKANRQRIRANIEPEGNAMTPRAGYDEEGRKLRKNERLKPGQEFYYIGPYTKHYKRIRRLKNVKTPASAAAKTRIDTAPYDPQYEWGYELETGGVSKFNRDYIRVMDGKPAKARLKTRMFTKIHRAKYLQSKINSLGVAIKFVSGLTAYIAAAHQYGEDNRPERHLLGFSHDDLEIIENLVISHMAAHE